MSFKQVKARSRKQPEEQQDTAQPGAIPTELLSTVEAEVSTESAPLLEFLVRHARAIGLLIVLFIVVVAGYGIYSWQSNSARRDAAQELGKLVIVQPSTEQLQKVLTLADSAPSGVRAAAYLEAAAMAQALSDKTAAADAWEKLADTGGALGFSAQVNRAQQMQANGNAEGAARIYQSLLNTDVDGVKDELTYYLAMAWTQAAATSDTARAEAVKAFEALLNSPTTPNKEFYRHCIARLGTAQ